MELGRTRGRRDVAPRDGQANCGGARLLDPLEEDVRGGVIAGDVAVLHVHRRLQGACGLRRLRNDERGRDKHQKNRLSHEGNRTSGLCEETVRAGQAARRAAHGARGRTSSSARRSLQERADEQELVHRLDIQLERARTRGGNPRLQLERRAGSGRHRPHRLDAPGREEERTPHPGFDGRGEDAELQGAQLLQPPQMPDEPLERLDAVAQPCRVLVAQAVGQVAQLRAQSGEGPAEAEQVVQLGLRGARESARGELGLAAAADRADLAGRPRDHDPVSARPQIDVAVRPRLPRVRRRAQLPDESQLLQPGLELRAEHVPLDAVDRGERDLDRRPLALGAEVRAKSRPQVARAADIEHLRPRAEPVHAGTLRRSVRERALVVDLALARCTQFVQVGERARAAFLGKPDQGEEDLAGRLGVRQRAVARLRLRAEEVRERGEARPGDAAGEERPRERQRVEHGGGEALAGQTVEIAVEERAVEARVVGDEHRVAGEGHEAADRDGGRRRSAQIRLADAGQGGDRRRQLGAGVDQRFERRRLLQGADADGSDLADSRAAAESCRLEIEDHVVRLLEQRILLRPGDPDRRADPAQPRVAGDQVVEQRAGEALRDALQREELPGRVRRRHRRAALLEQLDQAVGGVEGQLHASDGRRTCVRLQVGGCRCGLARRARLPDGLSEASPAPPTSRRGW